MKVVLVAVALLLLGSGSMVLISESKALSQFEYKQAAFANGNGFGSARDAQDLLNALASNDTTLIRTVVETRLTEMPFNPLLLGLKARLLAGRDVWASANLLDQAQAIAPRDPRVQLLRAHLQVLLQTPSSPASQPAE